MCARQTWRGESVPVIHADGARERCQVRRFTAGELRVGDTIRFRGHTTDLTEKLESIQIEHEAVDVARPGDSVALKVTDHVREHDEVFKVTED